MRKRETRNYDKDPIRTYQAMRQAVIKSDLILVHSDKETGVVDAKSKSSFVFFGGDAFKLNILKIDEHNTQVVVSVDKQVNGTKLTAVANEIFDIMDSELPIGE